MAAVIEIEGLRKEYRRLRKPPTVALDGLDLEVPEGGVFGFLGPNGAGKTTTIRCLLGLVSASAGRARLLGNDVPHGLSRVIQRVGSIVEAPALFPRFTGSATWRSWRGSTASLAMPSMQALDRVGPHGPRERHGQDLLAGDEATPRHRRGAAQGPLAADPGRARQRPRPRRDRRGARPPAEPRRRGPDRVRLEPHPLGGPAGRRSGRDPRSRSPRRCRLRARRAGLRSRCAHHRSRSRPGGGPARARRCRDRRDHRG